MAQRGSVPPEHSAVFERPSALPPPATPPVVVASACRTTREVIAWSVASELGVRCYAAGSAADALARLGLDAEGTPLTERFGEAPPRPGTVLLDTDLLLEPGAGPALCRALHELDLDTVILRGSAPRDLVAAERTAATVVAGLRAAAARCA
jgi:hypothetical protein